LAASFVNSIQAEGVGATLKHYVANDSENERFTLNVNISDEALHEIYLKPFEIAIHEANPWLVMCSYNSVRGVTMSENELLIEPLKGSWGWDGVVISDWTAVRSVIGAGAGGTDLEMPGGPSSFWGTNLLDAVKSGDILERDIDRKVERILRLAERVGALGNNPIPSLQFGQEEIDATARAISAEGTVLVKNNDVLPLAPGIKIGVFGSHAQFGREQGGGSATVVPSRVHSPLEGLLENAPEGTSINYEYGVESDDSLVFFDDRNTQVPGSNESGLKLEIFGEDNELILSEVRKSGRLILMEPSIALRTQRVTYTTIFTPHLSGNYRIGAATVGDVEYQVMDQPSVLANIQLLSGDFAEYVLNPPEHKSEFYLEANEPVHLKLSFFPKNLEIPGLSLGFGYRLPVKSHADALTASAKLAEASDVSIVFVGTNSMIESEGWDRQNLKLPEGQDELVKTVASSSKKTIVVINAGSPVEMPWFPQVDAVLISWFPGQQMGNAIADVLYGSIEPGGHLPTTWPIAMADLPVWDTNPIDGELEYGEGIYIGYRAWHKHRRQPLLPFGYGLGYSTFHTQFVGIDKEHVVVEAKNVGNRTGSHLVQIYGTPPDSGIEDRRLIGFGKVLVEVGNSSQISIDFPESSFSHWEDGWVSIHGRWLITIAEHSFDSGKSVEIEV
jgi:beta-glucosidase